MAIYYVNLCVELHFSISIRETQLSEILFMLFDCNNKVTILINAFYILSLLQIIMNVSLPLLFRVLFGGGPKVVVSTAAFHVRVRGSFPDLGGLKETLFVLPHPLLKLYCGEPQWLKGSVLGLISPEFECILLFLEGSVISPSSEGSLGPI